MSRFIVLTPFFASLLVPFVTVGCSSYQPPRFNRPTGAGSESILVVPFSEPKRHRWYGESERGEMATEAFSTWAMANASPTFPEGKGVRQVLETIRNWEKSEIEAEDWQNLTNTLGVKYILVGEIEDLSLTRPKTIGVFDAWLRASYRVIDVPASRTVWQRNNLLLRLGEGKENELLLLEVNTDKDSIERKLLVKLGQHIGQELYGYDAEDG